MVVQGLGTALKDNVTVLATLETDNDGYRGVKLEAKFPAG